MYLGVKLLIWDYFILNFVMYFSYSYVAFLLLMLNYLQVQFLKNIYTF